MVNVHWICGPVFNYSAAYINMVCMEELSKKETLPEILKSPWI